VALGLNGLPVLKPRAPLRSYGPGATRIESALACRWDAWL